jgi:predicted transcriptional regulator YheO
MDRNAKLRVVKELEQRGLFLVKGSVELVAERLGISKYTLYTYIDEIKQEEQQFE